MKREDIEKLTQNIVDLYRLTYKDKSEFIAVDVVDIAHMLGFKVFCFDMEDRGVSGALAYHDYEDVNGLGEDYIVIDSSLDYEGFRSVLSDVLVSHLIECNINEEDKPHNLVSLEGEAMNFELVLPKKEFLQRYQELSNLKDSEIDLVSELSIDFMVPEEAIIRRLESLEMNVPLTIDEAYEKIKNNINMLIKRSYS